VTKDIQVIAGEQNLYRSVALHQLTDGLPFLDPDFMMASAPFAVETTVGSEATWTKKDGPPLLIQNFAYIP